MSLYVAAVAAETDRGWGNFVALAVAGLLFWFGTAVHKRWKASQTDDHSPTPSATDTDGIKPQVNAPVDPVDPAIDPVTHDWGRIDYSSSGARVAVPSAPGPSTAVATADLDEFVDERLQTARPADVIREAKSKFGRSQATVKRAIRRVRAARGADS